MPEQSLERAPHPALRAYVDPYVCYHHRSAGRGRHRGMPSDRLTVTVAFEEPLDSLRRWAGTDAGSPNGSAPSSCSRPSRRQVTRGMPLTQAAAARGYADQPHLIREWRDLSGYTPTEYLRAELPFLQDRGEGTGADLGP
jgi:AraC-like DNA-binding protein